MLLRFLNCDVRTIFAAGTSDTRRGWQGGRTAVGQVYLHELAVPSGCGKGGEEQNQGEQRSERPRSRVEPSRHPEVLPKRPGFQHDERQVRERFGSWQCILASNSSGAEQDGCAQSVRFEGVLLTCSCSLLYPRLCTAFFVASYMKLLPPEIVCQLPFRFFKIGGTSEAFLDQVRATEGDVQVQRCPDTSGVVVVRGGVFWDCHFVFVPRGVRGLWGLKSVCPVVNQMSPPVDVRAVGCSADRKVSSQDARLSPERARDKRHAEIHPVCKEAGCEGEGMAQLEVQPQDSRLHPVRRGVEHHL